jgi:hypothetical protein
MDLSSLRYPPSSLHQTQSHANEESLPAKNPNPELENIDKDHEQVRNMKNTSGSL